MRVRHTAMSVTPGPRPRGRARVVSGCAPGGGSTVFGHDAQVDEATALITRYRADTVRAGRDISAARKPDQQRQT
ncbi:hypothetical protein GCM10023220_27930 [Streptomyces ziwulingensis]|uniref:Uncharacterized protein n=1 Tax=Streptomyces ziwulingensis TaxID=1045501 RepID=A0ABP9BSC0_9ACTN